MFQRLAFTLALVLLVLGTPVTTQAATSSTPEQTGPKVQDVPALQSLLAKKINVLWMGRQNGLDGWIATQGENLGVFYTSPDGRALISGQMFDEKGQSLTLQQIEKMKNTPGPVGALITKAEKTVLANDAPTTAGATATTSSPALPTTISPSEKLYAELESSSWFTIGSDKAPVLYLIFDPTCPHCKAYFADLVDKAISKDRLQVRMIPVAILTDASIDMGARLLGATDPTVAWAQVLAGKNPPPPSSVKPQQLETLKNKVSQNTTMFTSWNFEGVPISVYRNKNGQVMLIKGRAQNVDTILAGMASHG